MTRRQRRRKHYIQSRNIPSATEEILSSSEPLYSPDGINIMAYGPGGYEEKCLTSPSEIKNYSQKWPMVWVAVDGLGNSDLIIALGKEFGLSNLLLEDMFDISHLSKIEMYEKFIFIIMKNGIYAEIFETEQVSVVMMEKMVLTVQEKPGDCFKQVRAHIREGVGRIRQSGADYLALALMDAVVENYYPILEKLKRNLDQIEDNFVQYTGSNVIRQIHDAKNDLLFLHSAVWPMRDIVLALSHDDLPVMTNGTKHNLRDCQDHTKQVIDLTEFYRLIANDLMSTYLAFSDNKANEVMKLLTMVSTIFIPLSFLAGVYGMNFDRSSPYNMPELGFRYGYPVLLAVMFIIAASLMVMFWLRGWFRRSPK